MGKGWDFDTGSGRSWLPLQSLSKVQESKGWNHQLPNHPSSFSVSRGRGVTPSPAWDEDRGSPRTLRGSDFVSPLQVQTLRPENLLLVSTLDGSLHALSKQTGDLKWTLRDGEQGASILSSLDPELEWCHYDIEDKNMGSRTPQASVCRQLHH